MLKSFWAWYASTFKKAKFWGKIVILFLSFTFIVCLISVPAAIFDKSTPTLEPDVVFTEVMPTLEIPTAKPLITNTPVVVATSAPTIEGPMASRCVPASEKQFLNIQDGVNGLDANNSIKTAWAVKSTDFNNVWMVAAFIYGPGIEEGAGPGVWAISGDPDNPGLTLSVDGFAKSFTSYPDASQTDAKIMGYEDGIQEAIECAKMNK